MIRTRAPTDKPYAAALSLQAATFACDTCPTGLAGHCPASPHFPGLQLTRAARKQILAGAEIYPANETPSTVSIIQSGWAVQYARLQTGERQILYFLLPGDVFDQDAVIMPQTATLFGFSALTDVAICQFSIEEYRELLQADVRSRRSAKRQIRRRQALMAKHLINMGQRRALGRLVRFLLELRQRLSEQGLIHNETMPFPLRQEDIADALGLTHAHVNRTLRHLREIGAIEFSSGTLHILDVAALTALAPGALVL